MQIICANVEMKELIRIGINLRMNHYDNNYYQYVNYKFIVKIKSLIIYCLE